MVMRVSTHAGAHLMKSVQISEGSRRFLLLAFLAVVLMPLESRGKACAGSADDYEYKVYQLQARLISLGSSLPVRDTLDRWGTQKAAGSMPGDWGGRGGGDVDENVNE